MTKLPYFTPDILSELSIVFGSVICKSESKESKCVAAMGSEGTWALRKVLCQEI